MAKKNQSRKNKRRRRRRVINIILLLIIAILIVSIVGVRAASKLMNSVNRKELDTTTELYTNDVDGYTNILLLGVDTRDLDDVENSRTDAIMVASINNETKEVTLTSIYRDTYTQMGDTITYDKMTHAHYYGGTEMSIQSVNRLLDLDIEQYVLMNFQGVAEAVDAMGGIEIEVEDYEIEELNKYTKETAKIVGKKSGEYSLVEKAGKQTLDGCQAVAYGRIRKGVGDDFKRTDRMRTVLKTVMKKAKTMNPLDLYKVAEAVLPYVQTNISNQEMVTMALGLKDMDIDTGKGFPYNKTTSMIDGVSYVQGTDIVGDVTTFHKDVLGESDYEPSDTVNEISYIASAY